MRLVLLFTLFIIALTSFGQNRNYKHFSTNSGLSSSEAYSVIQDDWGYIWISTDHGLNRYDGYQMEHFNTEDGLTDNTVFRFKKDPFGRIWCTTYNSTLFLITGKNPEFIPYKHNDLIQEVAENRILKEIYFDNEGSLYLTFVLNLGYIKITLDGQLTDKLSRADYTTTNFRKYNLGLNKDVFFSIDSAMSHKETKISRSITNISTSESFRYYRTNMVGFSKFETYVFALPKKIIIHSQQNEDISIPLTRELTQLEKFDEEHFWFSGKQLGLCIYNTKGKLVRKLLDGYSVTNCHIDHEGSLWVTTLEDGVFLAKNWEYQNLDPLQSKIAITDLVIDNNQQLWLGYSNGDIYLKDDNHFKLKSKSSFKRSAYFELGDSGEVYFSHSDHIFDSEKSDSISVGFVYQFKIINFKEKKVLLSNYGGIGIKTKEDKTFKQFHIGYRVKDFKIIENNKLILASHSGLYISDRKNIQIFDSTKSIFSQRFDAVDVRNGAIAAGTRGSGLVYIENSKSFVINSKDGLAGDFVNTVCFENDSALWVGTNRGISILTKSNNNISIQNIGREKGLMDDYITKFAFTKDTIWVGTRIGLSYLLRTDLQFKSKSINYPLRISEITINGVPTPQKTAYKLTYDQNKISFNFLSFSFSNSQAPLYRYKLKGLENKWNYSITPKASYANLAAGEYTFIVQFRGENNTWNTEAMPIQIHISPPFWKTWWFIITTFSLGLGFIYLFFKYKVIIYNGDVLREILRYILKKLKKDEYYIIINEAGKEFRINTAEILYVKSDKNYLEIYTTQRKHVIREKIGSFMDLVPDPLEFIRVKRSYIVRIDKVTEKGKKHVKIDQIKIEVGDTYLEELEKIHF